MNYDNSNRGALFKADKKGNERRPDYTGTLNVAGVDYQLSAWLKASKKGDKYMSLSVQPKRETDRRPERGSPRQTIEGDDWIAGKEVDQAMGLNELNDDIPF